MEVVLHHSNMTAIFIIICACLWGITTFLQKLSCEHMHPILVQVIVAFGFILYIPIAFKIIPSSEYHWSKFSICVSLLATALSLVANILLYTSLRHNENPGSSVMLVCLYPVVTLLLSVIFLHEQLSVGKMVGILGMIIGACFLSLC